MAAQRRVDVQELAYDLMLENDGRGILNRPIINYADFNLEAAKAMIEQGIVAPRMQSSASASRTVIADPVVCPRSPSCGMACASVAAPDKL